MIPRPLPGCSRGWAAVWRRESPRDACFQVTLRPGAPQARRRVHRVAGYHPENPGNSRHAHTAHTYAQCPRHKRTRASACAHTRHAARALTRPGGGAATATTKKPEANCCSAEDPGPSVGSRPRGDLGVARPGFPRSGSLPQGRTGPRSGPRPRRGLGGGPAPGAVRPDVWPPRGDRGAAALPAQPGVLRVRAVTNEHGCAQRLLKYFR